MEVVLPVLFFAFATGAASLVKIPVPGTLVPVTLQSAIVLMSGLFLGSTRGAASQMLYIALGSLGLPFFAASASLVGPTGGYIFGFVLAAFLSGYAVRQNFGFVKTYGAVLLASLGIFLPGVLWLKVFTGQSWSVAFSMGFVPFIVGDLIKTGIAVSSYSVFRAARAAARNRKNTEF